ncbi:hypothetical protein SSTU70S_05064 [Stutzerimonas stutzeri]
MYDQTLLVLGRVDVPQLLDADAVMLRIDVGVELEAVDQLLADMTAAALGEQRVLGAQFHPGRVHAVLRIAFAVDAQITGDDPAYHALLVDQRHAAKRLGNAIATVQSTAPIKVITVRATGFDAVNGEGGSAAIERIFPAAVTQANPPSSAKRWPNPTVPS